MQKQDVDFSLENVPQFPEPTDLKYLYVLCFTYLFLLEATIYIYKVLDLKWKFIYKMNAAKTNASY